MGAGDLINTANSLMPQLSKLAHEQFSNKHINKKEKQRKVKAFSQVQGYNDYSVKQFSKVDSHTGAWYLLVIC